MMSRFSAFQGVRTRSFLLRLTAKFAGNLWKKQVVNAGYSDLYHYKRGVRKPKKRGFGRFVEFRDFFNRAKSDRFLSD